MSKKKLKEYQSKRDFTRSPEPPGESKDRKTKTSKLIFCVQMHLASHLHYDFRLEHNGVMLSWAVPKGPSLKPADKRLAMQVEDHPKDYTRFEGIIPSGYGAGIVMLWDYGTWEPITQVTEGLKTGSLKFNLFGSKLKGSWALVRIKKTGETKSPWLLIKHADEWSGDLDILKFAPLSIKTNQDFSGILSEGFPEEWKVKPPAKGGEAGAMYKALLSNTQKGKSPVRPRKNSRR